MRKAAFIIGGILVLLVILLAIAPWFINFNQFRGRIQTQLQQQLNRPVSLGQLHGSLLPPSVTVDNVSIGEGQQFQTGRPFASADQLKVSLQFFPLLRKQIAVNSIELVRPKVELVKNQQGVWNFSTLGKPTGQPSPGTAPPPQEQAQQKFSINKLALTDGTVAVTDLQANQPRTVYDHIDLTLKNFAPDKRFDLALAAHLPGQGKQVAKLEGSAGPIDQGNFINTPFDGKITLDQVSLDGAQKFLNSQALANTNATITGHASIKNDKGSITSTGNLDIANAVVHGHEIGYPILVDYEAADDLNRDFLRIGHLNLTLNQTPFSLSGTINSGNKPALLGVNFKAGDVAIGELAKLAGAFGYAFNPDMQVNGRIKADVHAQGSTDNPVLNGEVNAHDLLISGKSLPQPVKVQQIALTLTPDAIRSGEFTATTAGTSVGGHFALTQYTSKSPSVSATLKIPETNLADVLNIAHSFGAAQDVSGSGRIALNLTASGPVKNTAAMAFSGNGSLRGVTIHTPSLTQPVNVQNAALNFSQSGVAIDNFAGSVASTHANGRISVRNFAAPNIQLALNIDKLDALELQKLVPPSPASQSNAPSPLLKATGGGPVTIGSIVYDQLVLKDVKSTVIFDHGVIRLSPTSAQVAGGLSTGSISIDMRQPQTQFAIAMNVQKVDANQLLSSVSSVKNTLYGLLASNMHTQFHSVAAGKDIASTLNGRVSLNLSDGKLAGVDLLHQLSQVEQFQSLGRAATGATELQKLSGDFDIQNGIARTDNLRADIGSGTLAASGLMSLVDNSINMKLTAVLNKAYSQQVGGSQIGGFMRTALANNQGELVLPVIVTGTLQSPKIAPDLQAIAQMKLQNLVPTLTNPAALTSIFGKKGGAQGQQANPVGQIIDALGGKKPQQAPNNNQQQGQPQQQAQPQTQQQQNNVGNAIQDALQGLFGNKKKKQQQQPQPQNPQQPPPPQ